MKIMIAVHHFPPQRTAGAELAAYRTAVGLLARGHQVQVIAVESTTMQTANGLVWRDEDVDGIPVRWLSFDRESMPNPGTWEYDNQLIGAHLESYLAQERPDVFVLYSGYLMTGRAILTAKAAGIPTVTVLTEFWYLCRRLTFLRTDRTLSDLPIDPVRCARCIGEEQRRYRLLGRFAPHLADYYWQARRDKAREIEQRWEFCLHALGQADRIVSPSQFLASKYVEAGVPGEKIVYCRHGQATDEARGQELDKRPSAILRLAYIGQVTWHKGVHVLIEACRRLPNENLQLRIYGNLAQDKDYVAELRRLAADDARICFEGYFPPDDICRIYEDIDVLVVPSMWYENSPLTIYEAFMYGSPVIASNIGGMAEAVQHGKNGLLFQIGDEADLAHQIQRLLHEPQLVDSLRAGIQPVKTINEEVRELEAIFFDLHTREKQGHAT